MEPISPKHITVTDPFWAPRIRTVADIVLPYQWQVLHDQDRCPDVGRKFSDDFRQGIGPPHRGSNDNHRALRLLVPPRKGKRSGEQLLVY